MQGYNCILVYHNEKDKLLFCKRTKEPYLGLYNLVGGKIENGEDGYDAAYRELKEETGIDRRHIHLRHMMDFTYYNQDCYVEVYVGTLHSRIRLREEQNPLVWLDVNEDFFDCDRFAGEGNIGHMVEQVRRYGIGADKVRAVFEISSEDKGIYIGADGCKGGWVAAVLDQGRLIIDKYNAIDEMVTKYKNFDEFLVDMVIGLQSTKEHVRPDSHARGIIRERSSTVFPSPCRQAVYAKTTADAYKENEKILGKKFTPLTVGIIPKMREIDSFLQNNPEYKNVIKESHPEVCFAKLKGSTVMSKKTNIDGMEERICILSKYVGGLSLNKIAVSAKSMKCNVDDVIDSICLAVTAYLAGKGECETIPNNPMMDETGLFMQMVIPKKQMKQF